MAKKDKNTLNDDFDIDNGLEEFDFDFDEPKIKDDRKPITRAAIGAMTGAKEHLTSSAFIKDAIKNALPEGFGNTIDLGDKVTESLKDMYNESVADIRPVYNQAKQAAVKLIPADSKLLPKRIKTLLADWKQEIDSNAESKGVTATQGRDALMSSTLQDIFKAEVANNQEQQAQQVGKDRLKEGVDLIRHRSLLDSSNRSSISLSRLDNYQTRITLNYQKKSLELKYRSLFATQDLLLHAKESAIKRDTLLESIVKNSALPEYVKIKDSEARKQIVKNKLYDKVASALYGDKHDFIGKTIKNVKDKAMGSIKEFAGGVKSGLEQADMAVSMTEGMDIDRAAVGGQVVGSMGADKFGQDFARWAKGKIVGSKLDKKLGISDKGHKLNQHINNLPAHVSEFKRSNKYAFDDSIFGKIIGFVQDQLPGQGVDKATVTMTGKDMDSPFHFTKGTDRSINQIIPGYLARIFRELQVTRTGNLKTQLTDFDHDTGRFTGRDKLAVSILRKAIPRASVSRVKGALDDLIKQIDPDGKLTPEQHEILRKKLLSNSSKNNYANKARLGNASQYKDVTKEHADAISAHMSGFIDGLTPEQSEHFTAKHNAISEHIGHPGKEIQQQLDLGNIDHLRKLGLIDKNGTINADKINEYYLRLGKKPVTLEKVVDKHHDGLPNTPITEHLDKLKEITVNKYTKVATKAGEVKDSFLKTPTGKKLLDHATVAKRKLTEFEKIVNKQVKKYRKRGEHFTTQAYNELKAHYDAGTLPQHLKAVAVSNANTLAARAKEAAEFSKNELTLDKLREKTKNVNVSLKDPVVDIYVEGEETPRITAIEMRLGGVFDKNTGKAITKASEITGAVVDSTGLTRLSAEDVPKLLFLNPLTKTFDSLKSLGAKLNSFVNQKISSLNSLKTKGIETLKTSIKKNAASALDTPVDDGRPKDIYVEGEETPRLIGIEIEKGSYTDAATDEVIKTEKDIKGPIKDKVGKIVVSLDDLPKLRFFNITLRKWSPLWIAKNVLSGLWHFQTKIAPGMAKSNLKFLWTATKAIGRLAKDALGITGSILGISKDAPKDVYIRGGSSEPVLIGYKFLKGAYIDRDTKKTIWSEKDIEGPVADAKTNETLIDVDDLNKLYTLDSLLGKLNPLKLVGWLIKAPFRAAKYLANKAWKFTTTTGVDMAKGGLKLLGRGAAAIGKALLTGLGLRMKAQDVCVPTGSGVLVALTGIGMKAGQYVSALTGNVISSPSDIDGAVKDRETQETLLTKEQIEAGIYTATGTQIKIGKLKAALSKGFTTLKKILNPKVKTTLKVNLKDKSVSQPEAATIKSALTLEKILDAIKNFGQKDKVRKGSYSDEMATEKEEKTEEDKAKDKKGNLADKAAAAAAGKDKKDDKEKEGGGVMDTVKKYAGMIPGAAGLVEGAVGLAATGASAVGGALLTGAGFIGGGLLTLLSSPVVLAAGAVALAGYGGYKLYKHLSRGSVSTIDKIRIVQYGFTGDDTDNVKKCIDLESYLSGFIKDGKAGVEVDYKNVKHTKLASIFDLDSKDSKQSDLFFNWFRARFQPVYMTHLTAIKAVSGKADLSKIGDLKPDEKKKYIKAVTFAEGPYDFNKLPLLDPKVPATTSKDVQVAVKAALDEVDGKLTAKPVKKTGGVLSTLAGAIIPSAGAATLSEVQTSPAAVAQKKLQDNFINAVSTIGAETMPDGSKVNAFDTIRYKSYGMTKLEADKVKSIQLLETAVSKTITYAADGKASWSGSSIGLLDKLKGSFGITDIFSPEGNDWTLWFTLRFLPAYVAYLSAVRVTTGKPLVGDPILLIKPADIVTIAKAIIGLGDIWSVKNSPWPKYLLNTDSKTTDENLGFLTRAVKEVSMVEQKAKPTAPQKTTLAAAAKPTPPPTVAAAATTTAANIDSASAAPDAETPISATGGAPATGTSGGMTGKLVLASGPIFDGRNAQAFLNLGKGVTMEGLNPAVKANFLGMVEEYGTSTGKSTHVNDGFRTSEKQAALKAKYGPRAAAPGSSLHEFGLALDVDSKTLNEMDSLGLMRKYGFTRPVGAESWHMEPIGIQGDLSRYKQDAAAATEAVQHGIGFGGGGIGTIASARPYSRDMASSLAISSAAVPAGKAQDPIVATATAPGNLASAATPVNPKPATPRPVATLNTGYNKNSSSADNETKPVATNSGGMSNVISPTPSLGVTNAAADPTVKVPDPKGTGVDGLRDTLTGAAKMVGTDPNELMAFAAMESDFNPNAQTKTSSAAGLMQFTRRTWREMLTKYGAKYGYSVATTPPTDAKAASIMGAHYIKEITNTLSKKVKRTIGVTEGYLGHFLGPGGATSFLNFMDANPNGIAATAMPDAAKSNMPIFYDGNRPRSFTEVYSLLSKRLQNKAKAFGITLPVIPSTGGAGASASKPDSAGDASASGTTPPAPKASVGAGQIGSSSYVPTPAAKAPQAATAASVPSMGNAYGFSSPQASVATMPTATGGKLDASLLANTESILNQQLTVQQQLLDIVTKMFGLASSKQDGDNTQASTKEKPEGKVASAIPTPKPYSIPRAPISMKRLQINF